MSIITITRPAKCKDCKWIKQQYLGKRKNFRCLNPMSYAFNFKIRLNDFACDFVEL